MDEKIDVLRQAEEYTIAYFSELDSKGSQRVQRVSSVGRAGTRYSLTPPGVPFFIHGKVAIRDRRDCGSEFIQYGPSLVQFKLRIGRGHPRVP